MPMMTEQAVTAIVIYQGKSKRGLDSFPDDSLGHATQRKPVEMMVKGEEKSG